MITIRFAGWISGRIVSLQPDTDIQKLLSNGNRIRIRRSETLSTIFWGFRLLEKVAHCTIIHFLFSEASFQPSVPWLLVVADKFCLNKSSHKDNWQEDKYPRWKNNNGLELKIHEAVSIRNGTSRPKKSLRLVKTSHIEQSKNRKVIRNNMTT